MVSTAIIRAWRCAMLFAATSALAACASVAPQYTTQPTVSQKVGRPYEVNGRWYTPKVQPNYDEVGLASWYGPAHQGKPTADGERFDLNKVSAAHKTLPLPCVVEVTNLDNGKRIRVRVNDRGPFVDGRIIDLSQAAARELGFEGKGLAHVRVRYVGAGYAEAGETAIADARF